MGKEKEEIEFYRSEIMKVLNKIQSERTIKLIYGFVLGGYEKEKQTS